MGADQSTNKVSPQQSKYGHIFLKTDKYTYNAGETVTGNIYMYLFQQIPSDKLFLRLKGRELVQFRTRYRKGISWHYKKNNIFVGNKVPLNIPNPSLSGQVVIPFAFILPTELPTTFFQKGERYLSDIRYLPLYVL